MHVGKVTVEWLCRERGTWGKRGWLWREWRREWLRGRAGRCVRLEVGAVGVVVWRCGGRGE